MHIKIKKLHPDVILPEYQTEHAAAMDVHAYLSEPKTLQPMERAIIPTGLAFELPEGTELQVRARSGLSIKHGITLVNAIGTIDADYRGELGVLAINLGQEPFVIEPGLRIAQVLVSRYEKVTWDETDTLQDSARGSGGYGSTGIDNHPLSD